MDPFRPHQGYASSGTVTRLPLAPDGPGPGQSTAAFGTPHRVCESCGSAMPHRMSRQRDEKGRLVCDNCKSNHPAWSATRRAVSLLATAEEVDEFMDRLPATVTSIKRVADGTITRTAHDMGDGGILNHCPFCGSGAVTGGSDGSVECGFCHTVFTVQIQPQNPSMPQTVNGQPFVAPGMPAGETTEMSTPTDPVADANDTESDPDQQAGAPKPPGHPTPGDPNPSSKDMIEHKKNPGANPFAKGDAKAPAKGDGKDGDGKKKSLPPWMKKKTSSWTPVAGQSTVEHEQHGDMVAIIEADYDRPGMYYAGVGVGSTGEVVWTSKGSYPIEDAKALAAARAEGQRQGSKPPVTQAAFHTSEGAVLDPDNYLKRLALQHADDRQAVLEQVRASRGTR